MSKLSIGQTAMTVIVAIALGFAVVSAWLPSQVEAYWGGLLANAISGLAFTAVGLFIGERMLAILEERARLKAWAPLRPLVNDHLDACFIHIYGNLNVRLGQIHQFVPSKNSLPRGLRAWSHTLYAVVQRSRAVSGKFEWSRLSQNEQSVVSLVVAPQSRLILRRIAGRLRAAIEWREALPQDVMLLAAEAILRVEHAEDQLRLGPKPGEFDGEVAISVIPAFAKALDAMQNLFDRLKPPGLEALQ